MIPYCLGVIKNNAKALPSIIQSIWQLPDGSTWDLKYLTTILAEEGTQEFLQVNALSGGPDSMLILCWVCVCSVSEIISSPLIGQK